MIIDGIRWYPEVVKKMTKDEFIKAHENLAALQPKLKAKTPKPTIQKMVRERLTAIYEQIAPKEK